MLFNQKAPMYQTGFSLVEIMVGLVMGLIATLAIVQVLSTFEGQKRATTGTADAQTNGSIALYNIGRELQLAGYPLMPSRDSPLECTAPTYVSSGVSSISPVTITNGVAATGVSASDTITIRYGDALAGGTPATIGAVVGNDITVASNLGCQVDDVTLISNGPGSCALSKVNAVAGATTVTVANNAAAMPGANLACLGRWNEITYGVSNSNLNRDGILNVTDIVNLQAQYGISASANSNQVTQWVDASGGTWTTPSVADRNRIKAVRIAIVARNGNMEKENVTTACSSVTDAAPTGMCAWAGSEASPAPAIDLSAGDANWRRYRYRVFETIIPLRNMIWSKDTL